MSVETVREVGPHPNADRLDVARVGGYHVVVAKDVHVAGEQVVYLPEGALLPEALIAALGLEGRLAGKQKNRVKAIKLRGVISEGLLVQLDGEGRVVDPRDGQAHAAEGDLAEALGVVKWEPEIPVHLSGEVEASPLRFPSFDVEAWKRDPEGLPEGTPCVVTEKLHGTLVYAAWQAGEEEPEAPVVSSKGQAAAGKSLKRSGKANVYHQAVEPHARGMHAAGMKLLMGHGGGPGSVVCWIGEVAGGKVQDLKYGKAAPELALFDCAVDAEGRGHWRYVDHDIMLEAMREEGLPGVPEVARIEAPAADPAGILRMTQLADGETVWGKGSHIREGVVVKALEDNGQTRAELRQMRKVVSGRYLTRKGGKENR